MKSLNLFSYIPENFFNVLSGKYKSVYADLLYEIYKIYRETIYLIDKELIIDLFCDIIEDYSKLITDDEELVEYKTLREKANYFFRKFRDYGWLTEEQMMNHTWKVSIPDYSLRILETFVKITSGHQEEFRGRILSVYQNLQGDEKGSYIALEQAYENTLVVTNGLKRLNNSIKQYTQKLLDEQDIKEVLHQFFNEFESKIIGTYYYHLKSSDHVSKYRTSILKSVQVWQFDYKKVEEEANIMVKDQRFSNLKDSEDQLYMWLDTIERSFTQMDDILNEIDNRIKMYSRAAEQQIKLHIKNTNGLADKLSKALIHVANELRDNHDHLALDNQFNEQINLFSQEFIDENSWKLPSRTKPKQNSANVEITEIDDEEKQKELNKVLKKINKGKSIKSINQFVEQTLQTKEEMKLTELPLQIDEDWLHLIYIIIYSSSSDANYSMSASDDCNRVEVNGGIIPNKVIRKKVNTIWNG